LQHVIRLPPSARRSDLLLRHRAAEPVSELRQEIAPAFAAHDDAPARILVRDERGEVERVEQVDLWEVFAAASAESTFRRLSARWKIAYGWPCKVDSQFHRARARFDNSVGT
jgi:hypothetical protein